MISVITAGFFTTVQDLGRTGFAHIGVPVSGAMDGYAAQLANQLLSNSKEDAVLEITFGNCTFMFDEPQLICVTGADFSPCVDEVRIALNVPVHIQKGGILSFGKQHYGIRMYLAVKGGIKTEKRLESRSFYKGITKEFLLKKGTQLQVKKLAKNITETFSSVKVQQGHFEAKQLVCYRGPEYDALTEDQKTELEEILFTVSKDNSRMGYKLEELIENNLSSMLTSGVLPGTVQLTPSGKLIVLMRDCQVTGGYPRVLQLSEKAINQLAQKTTGDQFRFLLK